MVTESDVLTEPMRVAEPEDWDTPRACQQYNRDGQLDRFFVNIGSKEDMVQGLRICKVCPSLDVCHEWQGQRFYWRKLAGVVGGRWRNEIEGGVMEMGLEIGVSYDLEWLEAQDRGKDLRRLVCGTCGKVFAEGGGVGRWCSNSCRETYYRYRGVRGSRTQQKPPKKGRDSRGEMELVCWVCFRTYRGFGGTSYCGDGCKREMWAGLRAERNTRRYSGLPRTCVICEVEGRRFGYVTCGEVCGKKLNARRSLAKYYEKNTVGTGATVKCGTCGTGFQRNSNRRYYCSDDCRETGKQRAAGIRLAKKQAKLGKRPDCVICGVTVGKGKRNLCGSKECLRKRKYHMGLQQRGSAGVS